MTEEFASLTCGKICICYKKEEACTELQATRFTQIWRINLHLLTFKFMTRYHRFANANKTCGGGCADKWSFIVASIYLYGWCGSGVTALLPCAIIARRNYDLVGGGQLVLGLTHPSIPLYAIRGYAQILSANNRTCIRACDEMCHVCRAIPSANTKFLFVSADAECLLFLDCITIHNCSYKYFGFRQRCCYRGAIIYLSMTMSAIDIYEKRT